MPEAVYREHEEAGAPWFPMLVCMYFLYPVVVVLTYIGYSRGSIDGETFSFVVLFPLWPWVAGGIILVIFRDRIKKLRKRVKKEREVPRRDSYPLKRWDW